MTDSRHTLDLAGLLRNIAHASLALLLVVALGACGDDGAGPEEYDDISGSYVGGIAGTSQGVTLAADLGLTINQSAEDLSGSWNLTGQASDGVNVVDIAGNGPLSGSIESGSNPSVNVTIVTNACPAYTAQYSGAYDSTNRRLTITGPVGLLDDSCNVVWSSSATIILTK